MDVSLKLINCPLRLGLSTGRRKSVTDLALNPWSGGRSTGTLVKGGAKKGHICT